jgi:O-antigen/teichoic acid export membrane protein
MGSSKAVLGTATATAIVLGCGVVTGLIAARSLGPDGRGQLAAVTVWASTLLYAGTFGLPEAVAYFSAANPAQRASVWMTAQAFAALLGGAITAIGWWLIPIIFPGPANAVLAETIQWYLLLFAVPCLLSLCACAWLQGVGRLDAFNVSRTTVHVVNACGFVLLLLTDDGSVWHFAAAMLVGNAATWILASVLGPRSFDGAPRVSTTLAGRMFHYGARVQVGNWSNAANVRLDQLLLSLWAAPASLGIYVVAVTYANVVLTLPGSAALVMLPEMVSEHRRGAARECMERWYRRLLWTSAAAALVIGVSGMYLLPLLFGADFSAAVPLLVLLAPATVLLGMNQILSTAFRSVGRPEVGSTAELVGLFVTAASLVALLPRYGMYGAAAASLLAYAASHVYLLRRAAIDFESRMRSLCVPTRDDLSAGLHAAAAALRRTSSATPASTSALP